MGTRHAVLNAVATGKGREVEVLGNKKLRTSLQKNCQHVVAVTTTSAKMKGETTTTGTHRDGKIFRKGMNVPVRILAISTRKGLIIADAVDDHYPKERKGGKKRW